MAELDGFSEFVRDQLSGLGPVRVRRMFGGGGVYLDGLMFGLIAGDTLFLKSDDINRAMFEDEGMGPFVYDGKRGPVTMSYWQVPERLYDEPDAMLEFARAALSAARRNATARKSVPQRRKAAAKPVPEKARRSR
jgi:DNA transformation protein